MPNFVFVFRTKCLIVVTILSCVLIVLLPVVLVPVL